MNPAAAILPYQQTYIQPLSTTDAFVQSVLRALNIHQNSAINRNNIHVVASCALAVAASAVANAVARRITAVPDIILSQLTTQEKAQKISKTHANMSFLSFVLRLLRPYLDKFKIFRPLLRFVDMLERRVERSGATDKTFYITVPEKCSNDYYGAKPNIVFADLVWYAMTHESTVDIDLDIDKREDKGEDDSANGDELEVVQDATGGAIELRPSMFGDEVHRVYSQGDHRIFMVITTEVVTNNTLGTKTTSRLVKLSARISNNLKIENNLKINAFIAQVQESRLASQRDLVWKPVVNHWVSGAWKDRQIPSRKRFEHVAMPFVQKATLMADVEAFLGSEATYRRMGLSWNRGYLLHGPPGCGKSSCVSAMACTYRLPVYSVNLREVKNDEELRSMFSSLPERVMVVMEDVDCMTNSVLKRTSANIDQEKGNSSVTLSGILNVLDGIETGGGRLLVMTTNHKDALDPALVRPGRCDVHFKIGYSTFHHVEFLTKLYLGEAAASELDLELLKESFATANVTPAEVTGILLPLATTTLTMSVDQKIDIKTVSQKLVELCERVAAADAAKAAARALVIAEAAAAKVEQASASAAAVASIVAAATKSTAYQQAHSHSNSCSSSSSSNSSIKSDATSKSLFPATPPG